MNSLIKIGKIITHSGNSNSLLSFLLIILDKLQLYCFSFIFLINWDAKIDSYSNTILDISKGILFINNKDFDHLFPRFVISAIYLITALLVTIIVICNVKISHKLRNFIEDSYSIFTYFHKTCGFYLLFINHLQLIYLYLSNDGKFNLRSAKESSVIVILCIILGGINFILGALFIKLSSACISSKGGLSTKLNTVFFLTFIDKMLLILFYFFVEYTEIQSSMIFKLAISGVCFLRTYFSFQRFPYWKTRSNKVETVSNFLLASLNIIMMLGSIIKEFSNINCSMLLICWIVLIPFIVITADSSFNHVLREIISSSDKITYWHALNKNNVLNYITSKKLIKRESYKSINTYQLWRKAMFQQLDRVRDGKEFECLILKDYQHLVKQYQNCIQFKLMNISLMIKYNCSSLKIYENILRCESDRNSLEEKLAILILKDKVKAKIQDFTRQTTEKCNINVTNFIKIQEIYENLKKAVSEQLIIQRSFWQDMINRDTNFKTLFQFSKKIYQIRSRVEFIWKDLQSQGIKNFDSSKILYAVYLTNINNKPLSGTRILKTIGIKDMSSRDSHAIKHLLNNQSLYEKDTIQVILSSSQNSLGEINDATKSVSQLEYDRKELIGQNIDILMPPFFAKRHESKLKKFFETGESKITNIINNIFVKAKSGYYCEANLLATINPCIKTNFSLLGYFKLKKQSDFILISQDGKVEGFSENFKKLSVFEEKMDIKCISLDLHYLINQSNENLAQNNRNLLAVETNPNAVKKDFQVIFHTSCTQIDIENSEKNISIHFAARVVSYVDDDENLHAIFVSDLAIGKSRIDSRKQILESKECLDDSVDVLFKSTAIEKTTENISNVIPYFINGLENQKSTEFTKTGDQSDIVLKKIIIDKKQTIKKILNFNDNKHESSNPTTNQAAYNLEVKANPETRVSKYQASSSLGSRSSKMGTEMILEKSISYVLIKPKYIIFRWLLIGVIASLITIISSETATFIRDQNLVINYNQVVIYAYQRADYLVQTHYNLMQMKLALDGRHLVNNSVFYEIYLSNLIKSVSGLQDNNRDLYMSLSQLEDTYQDEFFIETSFNLLDGDIVTNNTKLSTTFQLIQEIVEISLGIIDEGKNITNSSQIRNMMKYLEYNILDEMLIACESSISNIQSFISDKFLKSKEYIETVTGLGYGIIVSILVISFIIIKYMCDDMNQISRSLGNLNELDAIAAKSFQEEILACLEEDCLENFEGELSLKRKVMNQKKGTDKAIRTMRKEIRMKTAMIQNLLNVSKAFPMIVINLIIIVVINSTTQTSIDSIQQSQIQIQSSLQLIYLSDLAFTSVIGTLIDENIPVKGQSIYSQANYNFDLTTRTDVWVSKFVSDKTAGTIIEDILYGIACDDPQLAIPTDNLNLCMELSGGSSKLGLLAIMATLAQQKMMAFSFLNNIDDVGTFNEAFDYIYNYFEPTNFFENYYLTLLEQTADGNLRTEIDEKSHTLMVILIPSIIVTLILLFIVDFFVVKKIIEQGNQVRSMISIIPISIILKTRSLKDYLAKNSGKLGDSIRKMRE